MSNDLKLLDFRCKMVVRNVAPLRALPGGASSQLNIVVSVSTLENRKERTTSVIMAAMAIVLGNGILEQKTSEGLREAGLAVSLAQNARLIQLSRRLSKTNNILREFFDGINQRAQAAKAAPPVVAQTVDEQRIVDAARSLYALHLVLEDILGRTRSHNLTNCGKFGVAAKLATIREYSDRVWGLADWLDMAIAPSEARQKIEAGLAEIERGEFTPMN